MAPFPDSLLEQVRQSVVAVYAGDVFLGSGFFVRPGVVVTCAHVVQHQPDEVTVRWNGRPVAGLVVVRDPPTTSGRNWYYDFPDLCFVALTEAVDHPYAPLAETPELPRELTGLGYSASPPTPGVHVDSVTLRVGGVAGQFVRVEGSEVVEGMSGAPMVDARTGLVHGVLKATRDPEAPRGGWMTRVIEVVNGLDRHLPSVEPVPPAPLRPDPAGPLAALLRAQRQAAERLPYQIVDNLPHLSDVYVHQRTVQRQSASPWDSRPASAALAQHRHVLVVGGPGAGKTTLLHHVILNTSRWWLGPGAEPPPYGRVVAVRIPARALASGLPWRVAVARAAQAELSDFLDDDVDPRLFARQPLPGIDWLLLIDGLDEVLDPRRREDLLAALAVRVAEYGGSYRFVVTSRNLGESDFGRLRMSIPGHEAARLGEYELSPFNRRGLLEFADHWFTHRTPADARERVRGYLGEVLGRGLYPLMRAPLLATIAAVVYEKHPGAPLPIDRTGLYERFVDTLLRERQARVDTLARLREQFAPYGPAAEAFATRLVADTEACLEALAHRLVVAEERPTVAAAVEWFGAGSSPSPGVPRLADHVGSLLTSSGLVNLGVTGLDFTHLSIAEYLAAGWIVRNRPPPPRQWVRAVGAEGPTSVHLFVLARAVRSRQAAEAFVPAFLRPGWLRRYPHLWLVCAVLRDGMAFNLADERAFPVAVVRGVRRRSGWSEGGAPAVSAVLSWLVARGGVGYEVLAMVSDRRLSRVKRVEAARAIVRYGEARLREPALAALEALASRPVTLERHVRVVRALAELGADERRSHAVELLLGAAFGRQRTAVRQRVLGTLMGLGEDRLVALALLARAADTTLDVGRRHEALTALGVVFRARPAEGDLLEALSTSTNLSYRLAVALELLLRVDRHGVEQILMLVVADADLGYSGRLLIARGMLLGRAPELGAAALERLADDGALSVSQRATAVRLLGCAGARRRAARIVRGWLADPSAASRWEAAALELCRLEGADAAVRAVRVLLADDRADAFGRVVLALLLGHRLGEPDEAADWLRRAPALPLRVRLAARLAARGYGWAPPPDWVRTPPD